MTDASTQSDVCLEGNQGTNPHNIRSQEIDEEVLKHSKKEELLQAKLHVLRSSDV